MDFYDLKQSGEEIQNILNSFITIQGEFRELQQKVSKIPIKVIADTSYDLNMISESAIYFIPTNSINKESIRPIYLEIYSDFVYVIHLQGLFANKTYKSQYLLTQSSDMKIVCYQRKTDSEGNFDEFVDANQALKTEIMDMFKITSWD